MTRNVGHIGKFSFVAMLLFLFGCRLIHSSELSQEPAKPSQAQLAGHQVLKWYKADDWTVALRFPGAIFQDDKERYWVGNGIGLASFDEKKNVWTSIGVEALGWRVGEIQQIAQSSERSLWIRSTAVLSDNLRFFDGERWRSMPRFAESRVSVIFPGAAGKLWFAVGDELVSYERGEWSRRLKVSQLISAPRLPYILSINSGLEDRDGFVWLAIRDGIVRLPPPLSKQGGSFDKMLPNVRCMYEDDIGSVWIGSYEGSISVYEKNKGSWRNYDLSQHAPLAQNQAGHLGLTKIAVNAILQDKSGQMMIATTGGLLTADQMGNNWQAFTHDNSLLPAGSITSMMRDKYDRIWLGTGEGILILGE